MANCGADAAPDEDHYLRVRWAEGCTTPGSSGSGLFLEDGRLVGTLLGGTSDGANPAGPDNYGSFPAAYDAALHRWLGP